MAKYLLLLKNQVSLITTYRFELSWRWLSNLFEIVVYFSLWSLTAQGNPTDLKKLLLYYILFFGILHNLQSSKAASWMGDDISSGNLNQYLTKPISFPLVQIIKTITILIVRVIVPIVILFIGSLFFPGYLAPAGAANFIIFLIFALLGLILWNLLMIILGSLAFWLTEIRSLVTVVDLIFTFLKGAYIPAYLFPEKIKTFLAYTPFGYLTSFPTDVYQGLISGDKLFTGLTIIITWMVILYVLCGFIYKRGIRRYEAFG